MNVLFENEARETVFKGMEKLYRAVKTTLGPAGRNVVIYHNGEPIITHDGVTVADAVATEGSNNEEMAGVDLIKKSAERMGVEVGDGTTTVTVLTYNILRAARERVEKGENPMKLWKQISAAGEKVQELLDKQVRKVDPSKLYQVASVSAGDEELGKLIADLVNKLGHDAYISIEESESTETTTDVAEGFTLDYGLLSPYLMTDLVKMNAEFDQPAVLVINGTINEFNEILNVVEALLKEGQKKLVIVAESMAHQPLRDLVLNKLQGTLDVAVVCVPDKDLLHDLAAVVGATLVDKTKGVEFSEISPAAVGTANHVVVTADSLTVVGGAGDTKEYIATIEGETERIARIRQKVGVIRVGGNTKSEIKEKYFRVEDAVPATKLALKDGIVPGGGIALYEVSKHLGDDAGSQVLVEALKSPYLAILENAGLEFSEPTEEIGVNVKTGKQVNMVEAGVVDPSGVTKEAVKTAVSIAGTGITMGALVVKENE